LEVIALDKYLHDVIRKAMENCGNTDHEFLGCEKESEINGKWISAQAWVVRRNTEALKVGDDRFKWWHDERNQFPVWIDMGFLYSSKHYLQKPHYDYQSLKAMLDSWVAFFGLTSSGMFLEIWPERPKIKRNKNKKRVPITKKNEKNVRKEEGRVVFLSRGIGLVVGGDTCHNGGLLCEPSKKYERHGHPRVHLYARKMDNDRVVWCGSPNQKRTRSTVHTSGVGIGDSKSNQYQEYDSETENIEEKTFTGVSADTYRMHSSVMTKGVVVGECTKNSLENILFG
jgi:hypothetical protein